VIDLHTGTSPESLSPRESGAKGRIEDARTGNIQPRSERQIDDLANWSLLMSLCPDWVEIGERLFRDGFWGRISPADFILKPSRERMSMFGFREVALLPSGPCPTILV